MDFDPRGEYIAAINSFGMCLISEVNSNSYISHMEVGNEIGSIVFEILMFSKYFASTSLDGCARCRWSSNSDEPLLFVKYNSNQLNIFDAEKRDLSLKNPIQLDSKGKNLR